MRRRVTVALSRLTRILLLVAVALCLGAPTAAAVPAKKLDNNLAVLWTTVLETPSAQNSFGSGGAAFACWNLGGTVAPFGAEGVESCTVKPGTKIFVAASAVECSTLEKPPFFGADEQALRDCAQKALDDRDDQVGVPTVTLDRTTPVPVTEVETSLLNIVVPEDNILGPDVPAGPGQSVGRGWVALLHPLTPGTHPIEIVSDPADPDNPTTTITTTIVVQPGLKP